MEGGVGIAHTLTLTYTTIFISHKSVRPNLLPPERRASVCVRAFPAREFYSNCCPVRQRHSHRSPGDCNPPTTTSRSIITTSSTILISSSSSTGSGLNSTLLFIFENTSFISKFMRTFIRLSSPVVGAHLPLRR